MTTDMSTYVPKLLQWLSHQSTKSQHCPLKPSPHSKLSPLQAPTPPKIKLVQWIIVTILYYSHAIDCTLLVTLSCIATDQTHATEDTMPKVYQLLDYLAPHPATKVYFHASDMVLNIHSDTSFLCKPHA